MSTSDTDAPSGAEEAHSPDGGEDEANAARKLAAEELGRHMGVQFWLGKAIARRRGIDPNSRLAEAAAVAIDDALDLIVEELEEGFGYVLLRFRGHWIYEVESGRTHKGSPRPNGWHIEEPQV